MADVKQSNPNAFAELELKLKQLDGVQTKVGWFASSKYEDGTPVAAVAYWQEKGVASRSIPPRPFFRPAIIKYGQSWIEAAGIFAKRVLEGKMTGLDAMRGLGEVAQGDVIQSISDVTTPPLSIMTLMGRKRRQMGGSVTGKTLGEFSKELQKGPPDVSGVSTKPLIDTGYMISTLTNETETK